MANYRLRVGATATPSYLAGAAVQQWVQIPNSTFSPDGTLSGKFSYSNGAMAGNEVIFAATGGHGDSSDSSVRGFDLQAATGWNIRKANSYAGEIDQAYYADGSASSVHTYNNVHYSTVHSRLLRHGTFSPYPNAGGPLYDTAGFNLANNTWDTQGTWDDVPTGGAGGLCKDTSGNVWAISDAPNRRVHKWVESTATWENRYFHNDSSPRPYAPMAFDSTRNQLFCLLNIAGSPNAVRLTSDGTAADNISITFNAALTAFLAENIGQGTMVYDEVNDRYLYASEKSSTVYEIIPNSSTTGWVMNIVPTTGETVPAPTDTFGRLLKWPEQKAIIMIPRANVPMYIMRYA